jgi:hypothetical protein
MNNITLVDIFFTITGAAIVLLTILLAVGIIYLVSIFRSVRRVVRTAEFATDMVKEDLVELRDNIKSQGFNLRDLLGFFHGVSRKRILSKRKVK